MFWNVLLITSLFIPCLSDPLHSQLPGTENSIDACGLSEDGSRINCQNLQMTNLSIRHIPDNVTSLDLSHNQIAGLLSQTFRVCARIKVLDLSYNNLQLLEPLAFDGLTQLQVLDLSQNSINTLGMLTFAGLSQLETLNLENNPLNTTGFPWPDALFQIGSHLQDLNLVDSNIYPSTFSGTFQRLQSLQVDTPEENFKFSSAFSNMRSLRSLTLRGKVNALTNDSFLEVESLPLETLVIDSAENLLSTEEGALQPLKSLQIYRVSNSRQSIEETLRGLYPFQKRNMTALIFYMIGKTAERSLTDGILDGQKSRYLKNICVENFVLKWSNIFVIERDTLTGPIWRFCLKKIDLSGNPLIGSMGALLELTQMRNLQFFIMRNRKKTNVFSEKRSGSVKEFTSCCLQTDSSRDLENWYSDESKLLRDALKTIVQTQVNHVSNLTWPDRKVRSVEFKPGLRYISLPKNLQILHLESFSRHQENLNQNVVFSSTNSLRELYNFDNGIEQFVGTITGLEQLRVLEISFNDCSEISPSFLDNFGNLLCLGMKSVHLDSDFMAQDSDRLYRNLSRIQRLDLSDNGLNLLAADTFLPNNHLQFLNLAGNRFYTVPFDITPLTNLTYLDLRWNSILHLSHEIRSSLDAHAVRVPNFKVLLEGNVMACGCSHLRFLLWLQETSINLDTSRNYTCITENGDLTSTYARRDIQAVWRTCAGKTAFFLSLSLLLIMTLGFVISILCFTFKTRVISKLVHIFSPQFSLLTPGHYPVGVFINYSDQDTMFACSTIRHFIEHELNMKTYLRDRDLIPATDIAESIVDTVNKSWRILFVVTQDYLYNDMWAYFAMKTATYTVGPRNPGRIVVLIDPKVRHKMPRCLLRATEERHIISFSCQSEFNYEESQRLRSALIFNAVT